MAKMKLAIATALLASTSIAMTAPAHADAATDFLTMVSSQGLNVGDTPPDVQITLDTANTVCQMLHNGFSPEVVERQVPYVFPQATPTQEAGFVRAAQATLCITAYAPLQPGGDY
ncbi:DUF732 domain-containing protein [Mycobacterium arosiense]|nr:DUF732 domain-containing protein [Mycobacterium arosiense]